MEQDITVKRFDPILYRRFKAQAIQRGLTVRQAIAEAMQLWIETDQRIRSRDALQMQHAIQHMDRTRTASGTWSAVAELRRWRERRT